MAGCGLCGLLEEDVEDGADVLVAAGAESESIWRGDRMADMALTGVALEVCSWWAQPAASGDFVDLHVRSFFFL
jgi:hypothetical protein